ncbi:MAG: hypothetical protein DME25_10460 [Verrucomicrobia bacterium]|nr:MAG: hypothetical protein DME25_10460 [Verrucomicrobiota bacterium]
MNYYCPRCSEIIHDRTRKICGICGAALPGEMLVCMAKAESLHEEAAKVEEGRKRGDTKEQKRCDGEALPS